MDHDHIYHALVLNMHQPSGNLESLMDQAEWEAKEILWALDRMPRALWQHEEFARVHVSLSGTLLETLSNPEFQKRVYGIMKCGDFLWHMQNSKIFEILGTGFYHPVFPLIPEADWDEQLQRWKDVSNHLLWRQNFQGFWPPEMGFCMEMIPYLKRKGYRYVLVDSEHIEPLTPMSWQEQRYRPHIAEYEGEEIIVVVRDRELSDAQESGMNYGWFEHELCERTKMCDFPPLVTTCTDGDNGGWFRNTNLKSNFWNVFYDDFMAKVKNGWTRGRPTFIAEYLDKFGAHGKVRVRRGAWNTGWHNGIDFTQWTGSQMQKDALERIKITSAAFHQLRANTPAPEENALLKEAHWRLLRAETSCNIYWGEAWVDRCHSDLDATWEHINAVKQSGDSA